MRPAALVTGGAVRIGRAICLQLAHKGYDIALHYHTSQDAAQQTAEEIRRHGVDCRLFTADLAQPHEQASLIRAVAAEFPAFSVLVNSASVFERGPLLQSDRATFDHAFALNLAAPVFLTQAFAQLYKKGCVVNLLDTAVTRNSHAYFFYLMSKKSLHDFTRMAAVELGPDIRVNAVCPGFVLPPEGFDEAYKNKLEPRLPLRKTPSPEAVAQAVYLMVDNSSLTGQVIHVDGGESLL
ncbi:MAG: SDR family oxidoreductase [Alphaproteobacteria bacterium]